MKKYHLNALQKVKNFLIYIKYMIIYKILIFFVKIFYFYHHMEED